MRPNSKLDDAASRAGEALQALEVSTSFEAAFRAWTDFLIFWRRALNHACGEGRRAHGKGWTKVDHRARAQPETAYLWEARNADEHGLVEVAVPQEAVREYSIKGDVFIQDLTFGATGPRGNIVPLGSGVGWRVRDFPEGIALRPIQGRNAVYPVPPGFELIHNDTSAPIALARIGMLFLESVIDEASAPRSV